jgi:hypothetical protein
MSTTVLAVGAWLKNAACLVLRGQAHWSPVHGDLSDPAACEALAQSVQALVQQAAAASTPVQAIAHDLHPDFFSTQLAVQLATALGVPAIGVQHHHAHIAAVVVDETSPEAIRRALADNRASDLAETDEAMLAMLLGRLEEIDLAPPAGFTSDDLDALLGQGAGALADGVDYGNVNPDRYERAMDPKPASDVKCQVGEYQFGLTPEGYDAFRQSLAESGVGFEYSAVRAEVARRLGLRADAVRGYKVDRALFRGDKL